MAAKGCYFPSVVRSAISGFRRLALVWILLSPLWVAGQNSHFLAIQVSDAERLPEGIRLPKSLVSSTEADQTLLDLESELHSDGYLQADFRYLKQNRDSTIAELTLGPRIRWIRLSGGNLDDATLRGAGFRERQYFDEPVRPGEITRLAENVLRYAENNGYPFAEVRLDSFRFEPDGVEAELFLDLYRFIVIDSLRLIDEVKIAPAFLRSYLNIREGQPYNEEAVRGISSRIRELNFLREKRPVNVQFYGDRAVLGLYLEEVNANQFDVLLGVLPNSAVTGKLALTGEFNLQLFNTFGIGEEMRLEYRRLQAGTQELKVNLAYPYIPYLPVGAHLDFNLYLRDSTFLERGTDFGLRYSFGGNDFLEGFLQNERYVLLNPDTSLIRTTRTLPQNLDVKVNRYGIAIQRERLDYRYNPRKGWSLLFRGSAGNREVLVNNAIAAIDNPLDPEFDYATLYDSISGSQASFQLSGKLAWFQPIAVRSVFYAGWEGGFLRGGQLLQNELFRLGGARRLRGFDEESIFASHFHILSLEYRFLLSQNSRFSVFSDLAWLEEDRFGLSRTDFPYGFGVGLDFETGAGIFGLSYALGSQQGNPIVFREAKLHFGYVNRF